MRLKDKVAIITGSSTTGIGYTVAKSYINEGAKVVICGISAEEVNDAKLRMEKDCPNAEFLAYKLDVTKLEDVEKVFKETYEKWGKIDILVNNAGIAPAKSIEEMTDNDFDFVMNVNTFGTFRCTREAVKYMKENGGSIINTSSIVGIYGSPRQSAYTASKGAINAMTKSNAKELGKYKIRVNSIAPGVVMTDMVKDNCDDATIQRLNMMTPLGRGAECSDLVGLYIYLASDESIFTTGTIINIDGGLVM